jgi:hypothetical protein
VEEENRLHDVTRPENAPFHRSQPPFDYRHYPCRANLRFEKNDIIRLNLFLCMSANELRMSCWKYFVEVSGNFIPGLPFLLMGFSPWEEPSNSFHQRKLWLCLKE